ncbi:beta-1,6-N-acetylglucosaminyltransferase [Halomonas binhaiensis]|uniref:Peptide O-xylosyltransferase n=1 Tax=Halomonas binhaiensis TaxID=2562282 RepID=A0A5C1NJ87_9GAMM|nr:beta-1,6-N-acetylglucosaminyltransferase [Halomonas binhaiensis]QEM82175.1 hypothetical protein E4T21_11925 [Halomonas binhaiensis]
MKVSFVLLAHEHPDQLRDLLFSLLSSGSDVFVHYDANASHDLESESKNWALEGLSGNLYFAERVKVVWGEWSIVQATLNCLYLAREKGFNSDYFMLISGSCMPVKPVALLQKYLSTSGKDHIEIVDAEANRWVTDGIQQERWNYFHFFNWRYQEFFFRASNKVQKTLGVSRKLPLNHIAHMGSQWWCLRSETISAILSLVDSHKELVEFYKKTWIPDELFFQTLVANLVPKDEVSMAPLTRYQFNSRGVPRVYYDDSLPELLGETQFFARKISHRAISLKGSLAKIGAMSEDDYSAYVEEHYEGFKTQFVSSLELSMESQANSWRSLSEWTDNPYVLGKAIPTPTVILCSLDKNIKKETLSSLAEIPGTAIYGDLLRKSEIDFGEGKDLVLGYSRNNPALAHHGWHFFLADIISQHANDERVVFTIGEEAFQHLGILKWNHNVTVILLDDRTPLSERDHDLHKLFNFSQLHHKEYEYKSGMQSMMEDRHCEYHIVDAADHQRIKELVQARTR